MRARKTTKKSSWFSGSKLISEEKEESPEEALFGEGCFIP
jgi:hypothetical protein